MTIDISKLTIASAHTALAAGEFSVRELVDAYLDVIAEKNQEYNVYLHMHDDIDAQVKKAETMFADGTATELTGIPCAIKSNLMRKGQITNAASKMLENYKATYSATVIERLENQGMIFLGSTNMDEFAMGSSTENSAYGVTKNPHDPNRVPGGSSGGSAAAVALDMALCALGTDTGGSIRQPASFCGVTGFKTTYGGVSRYGAIAMGSSLDQIGPFTKNATDAHSMWNALRGQDKHDMTTVPDDVWKQNNTKEKYSFVIPQDFIEGMDDQVKQVFDASVEKLKQAGHLVTEQPIPSLKYALPVYYVVMPAEVSSNLARYDGIRYGSKQEGSNLLDEYIKTKSLGFGAETKRRLILGTHVLQAGYAHDYYTQALAVREKLKQELEELHKTYDFVLTPTAPTPAFKIGEKAQDPLEMYLADIFTVSANIAGTPAISVSAGTVSVDGIDLPTGIQFMGAYGSDDAVLHIAQLFETL